MIIKRTRGVSATKALAYDYGPGRAQEHANPRRVAGSVAGRDWRARARAMQAKIREDGDDRKGTRGRVIRLAVSAAPQDRIMSDREWGQIARRVVDDFGGGADRYAWEAVRHDPRHIHITLLQRGHDGRLLSESHDYRRFGRIADGIERDHDLTRVPRTSTGERKATVRRRAKELHRGEPQTRRPATANERTAPEADRDAARPTATSREERLAAARRLAEQRAAERERQRQQDRERGRDR